MGSIRTSIAVGMLAVLAGPVTAQEAPAYGIARGYDTDGQSVDSIAVFFEPLAHYGRWLDSRYGRVWAPTVPRDWRPYTIGHWEIGAYGATWRSDEPFGWAAFHFGRWAFDPAIGWVWLPDTIWGPGWVAWRDGVDVTGWAPLPPQVNVLSAGPYAFNDWSYDQWYQPGWVYVSHSYLYARSLRGAYLPFVRNRDFWDRTHGVTRYDRVGGQTVNRSLGDGRSGDPRPDLRSSQTYAAAPRSTAPPVDVDAGGFVPMSRAYGDGFVPGAPRGMDRRAVPPVAGRPGVSPARGVIPPAAPRPAPAAPRPAPAHPAERRR